MQVCQVEGSTYVDTDIAGRGASARWRLARLRFCATINPTTAEIRGIAGDTLVSFVPMEAVGENGGLNLEQTHPLGYVAKGYTYFRDNDVIVAKITPCFENGKGSLANGLKNGIGFGTTELHVLRPSPCLDHKYLFYLTLSHAFRKIGASYMYGAGGQKRVPDDFIRDFRIALPPPSEQRTIATFLDRETTRIDTLIEKKQRQIELLQEKRTALISHAVTKGLSPNAKMKDSGVEWLGEIPVGWEIWKVTHAFGRIGSGTTPKSDNYEYYDGQIPWVTTSELRETSIDDTLNKVTEEALRDYPTLRLYPAGTLLFAMYGATIGRLGILKISAAVNQACAAFSEPIKLDPKFTYYWLYMRRPILIALSAGGGQPNLSQDDLKQLRIPTPPLNEQRAIATFLDHETAHIDALIEKVEKSITLLREYRTSLISAAVTGKIDVRKEAA